MSVLPEGLSITAPISARQAEILTPDALSLVAHLHRRFEPRRQALLAARVARFPARDARDTRR